MSLQDCDPGIAQQVYTSTDLFNRLSILRLNLWRYNVVSVAGGAAYVNPLAAFGEQLRGWSMPGGLATPRVQVLGKVPGLATQDGAAYAMSFKASVDAGTATIRARFLDHTSGAITGISDQSWVITTTPTTFTWTGIASDDPDFDDAVPNNSYFEFFVSNTTDIPVGKTVTITNLQIQTDNYWDQRGVTLPWRPAKGEPDLVIYGEYILSLSIDEIALSPNERMQVGPEGGGFILAPLGPQRLRTQAGTSDTLVAADCGGIVRYTSSSPTAVLVPTNAAMPCKTMTCIALRQVGTGLVTIAGDTGVTVNPKLGGSLALGGQYDLVQLLKVGTNEWDMI